jgi:hypothetical protein
MSIAISEALALGALSKATLNCPYSQARRHLKSCPCRGTGRVVTCSRCAGAGWDNAGLRGVCSSCNGCGVLSVPRKRKEP